MLLKQRDWSNSDALDLYSEGTCQGLGCDTMECCGHNSEDLDFKHHCHESPRTDRRYLF